MESNSSDSERWIRSMLTGVLAVDASVIESIMRILVEYDACEYLFSVGREGCNDYGEWMSLVQGYIDTDGTIPPGNVSQRDDAETVFMKSRGVSSMDDSLSLSTSTASESTSSITTTATAKPQKQGKLKSNASSTSSSKGKHKIEHDENGDEEGASNEDGNDDDDDGNGEDLARFVEEVLGKTFMRETLEFAVRMQSAGKDGCSDEEIIGWLIDNGEEYEKRAKAARQKKKEEDAREKLFRARIMQKYDEQVVEDGSSRKNKTQQARKGASASSQKLLEQIAKPLAGSEKSKVRYLEGKVVSTKGERYILESVKEEYVNSVKHVGVVKLKGKRGKGWVAV